MYWIGSHSSHLPHLAQSALVIAEIATLTASPWAPLDGRDLGVLRGGELALQLEVLLHKFGEFLLEELKLLVKLGLSTLFFLETLLKLQDYLYIISTRILTSVLQQLSSFPPYSLPLLVELLKTRDVCQSRPQLIDHHHRPFQLILVNRDLRVRVLIGENLREILSCGRAVDSGATECLNSQLQGLVFFSQQPILLLQSLPFEAERRPRLHLPPKLLCKLVPFGLERVALPLQVDDLREGLSLQLSNNLQGIVTPRNSILVIQMRLPPGVIGRGRPAFPLSFGLRGVVTRFQRLCLMSMMVSLEVVEDLPFHLHHLLHLLPAQILLLAQPDYLLQLPHHLLSSLLAILTLNRSPCRCLTQKESHLRRIFPSAVVGPLECPSLGEQGSRLFLQLGSHCFVPLLRTLAFRTHQFKRYRKYPTKTPIAAHKKSINYSYPLREYRLSKGAKNVFREYGINWSLGDHIFLLFSKVITVLPI